MGKSEKIIWPVEKLTWTAARDTLLLTLAGGSRQWDTMLDQLNRLPGKAIHSGNAVRLRFHSLSKNAGETKLYSQWTPERLETLRKRRDAKVEWSEILVELNTLPGKPIRSTMSLRKKYYRKRVSLSEMRQADSRDEKPFAGHPVDDGGGAAGISPAPRPKMTSKVIQNSPPVCKEPGAHFGKNGGLVVTYYEAKRWAVDHGICHRRAAMNLHEVNEMRAVLRMPKFEIEGAE